MLLVVALPIVQLHSVLLHGARPRLRLLSTRPQRRARLALALALLLRLLLRRWARLAPLRLRLRCHLSCRLWRWLGAGRALLGRRARLALCLLLRRRLLLLLHGRCRRSLCPLLLRLLSGGGLGRRGRLGGGGGLLGLRLGLGRSDRLWGGSRLLATALLLFLPFLLLLLPLFLLGLPLCRRRGLPRLSLPALQGSADAGAFASPTCGASTGF